MSATLEVVNTELDKESSESDYIEAMSAEQAIANILNILGEAAMRKYKAREPKVAAIGFLTGVAMAAIYFNL
ncbi:MAG: hypothetical protein OEZ68_21625 [Gammaproteobacteria bacterium]|nr:hypothetical protein [Gammaproteobacteria bacterium]MDH5803400.1 hypothetical protein [Gammaproteobacteria bacterium]